MELYRKYQVVIKFRDKLLGGIPRSDNLIAGWLDSRGMSDAVDKTIKEVNLVDEENKAWTGFKVNKAGNPIFEARCIEALAKESSSVLYLAKASPGLKQHLQHAFFVKPDSLILQDNYPDTYVELCAHVQGPRGPRSILKRHDYVEGVTLSFEIWKLDTVRKHNELLSDDTLQMILEHGKELGLGCSRSQGYGKFDLLEFKVLTPEHHWVEEKEEAKPKAKKGKA